MFFGKAEQTKKETNTSVVVIGRSALAFYLAAVLQEKGVRVVIKLSADDVKKNGKEKNILIKYSGKLKENVRFDFVDEITEDVDYCIVASRPEDVKTDFLLLADEKIKKTKIINFSACLNYLFFEKKEGLNQIQAFFCGGLVDDGKVNVLKAVNDIKVCCDDEILIVLKKLFYETNVVLTKESKPILMQKIAEMLAVNLLLLVYEKNISDVLANKKTAEKAEMAVCEICRKIVKEAKGQEKNVLQSLYEVVDGTKSEFSKKDFLKLLAFNKRVDAYNTPCVYEMMSKLIKR